MSVALFVWLKIRCAFPSELAQYSAKITNQEVFDAFAPLCGFVREADHVYAKKPLLAHYTSLDTVEKQTIRLVPKISTRISPGSAPSIWLSLRNRP
ncbi:MAG: hypothetical protein P4L92_11695 [Rudaea sp.]|nr:hypothetical protein [Rudaea sp.]